MAIFTTSRFKNKALEDGLTVIRTIWYNMSDEELEKIIKQREKEHNETIQNKVRKENT